LDKARKQQPSSPLPSAGDIDIEIEIEIAVSAII